MRGADLRWGSLNINLAEHQEAYEEAKRRLGITDAGVLSASQFSAAIQLAERILNWRHYANQNG